MENNLTWKEFTQRIVADYCNERGSRTFTLQELQIAKSLEIQNFKKGTAKTPEATLRRVLQELREERVLTFVENKKGTYTLREPIILIGELSEEGQAAILDVDPDKREYRIETYARDRGWVKEAKEKFGCYCLHPKCENTFKKDDGFPYIEVHHIIPLYEGGEDAVWNLAVVCAHHHKMAHFGDKPTRKDLEKLFLAIVEEKL